MDIYSDADIQLLEIESDADSATYEVCGNYFTLPALDGNCYYCDHSEALHEGGAL